MKTIEEIDCEIVALTRQLRDAQFEAAVARSQENDLTRRLKELYDELNALAAGEAEKAP